MLTVRGCVKIPVEITFRGLPRSAAIEADARDKASKLDQFCDSIMACRVMIESPHRRRHKGKLYRVRIDLTVPEQEIIVNRSPNKHSAHEDVYVALRDAFAATRRQLEDYARRRRGDTKVHPVPTAARVLQIFPAQDYGFLRTDDGRDIYFHRNSLVGADFDQLDPGMEVKYVEEQGQEGPQAISVTLSK
jgi:cold shock CspA family protein/ribosome-associated translation inhibitor RaiA